MLPTAALWQLVTKQELTPQNNPEPAPLRTCWFRWDTEPLPKGYFDSVLADTMTPSNLACLCQESC